MIKRIFNPYELSQLTKHNISDFDLEKMSSELGENFLYIPVEYITGFCEFRKHDFQVTRDTLIPRVETEEIVGLAFGLLDLKIEQEKHQEIIFADIGTGSGVIGISFARELLEKGIEYKAYLSDVSQNALGVTRNNAQKILGEQRSENIRFIESNLFEKFPEIKCDLVFANLPYIPSKNMEILDVSVRNFEPVSALDGGDDGLLLIRKLLNQVPDYLKQGGVVLLEVDDSHIDATEFSKTWNVDIKQDQFGNNRSWILKLK